MCLIISISQNEDAGSKEMKNKKPKMNVARKKSILLIVFPYYRWFIYVKISWLCQGIIILIHFIDVIDIHPFLYYVA
jgi:hypothetical protein